MSFLDSADDVSLASVDPNPSNDQGISGDGGASDFSTAVNAVGAWGSEIASVITGHAVQAVVTPNGGVRPIGAAGSTVKNTNTSQLLVIGVGILAAVALLHVMSQSKKRAA